MFLHVIKQQNSVTVRANLRFSSSPMRLFMLLSRDSRLLCVSADRTGTLCHYLSLAVIYLLGKETQKPTKAVAIKEKVKVGRLR